MSVEGSLSEKPKLLKVGDKVTIVMKVLYGEMPVTFTIIDDLGNYTFALLAQNRVCVGQMKVDHTWLMSDSVDLRTEFPLKKGVYMKMMNW